MFPRLTLFSVVLHKRIAQGQAMSLVLVCTA